MKDGLQHSNTTSIFLTSEKEPVSRVHLFIMEDGTFLVNGEKRRQILINSDQSRRQPKAHHVFRNTHANSAAVES